MSEALRIDGVPRKRAFGSNAWTTVEYTRNDRGFAGYSILRLQRNIADPIRHGGALDDPARDYLACLNIETAFYRSAGKRAAETL